MFRIFSTTKNSFEGQLPDEQTISLHRMHWFKLVDIGIILLILGLIPLLIYIPLQPYLLKLGVSVFYWYMVSLYYLFWWYGLFYGLTMYLLNVWLVTDHRVIASEQQGMFRRTVAELNLAKIQDISVRIEGPMQTMLNFGEIDIQTAGKKRKFRLKHIPNPIQVKDQIIKSQNEYLKNHPDRLENF